MTRFRFRWVVVPLALVLVLSNRCAHGQESDAWRPLSLGDFVREIERLTTAPEPLSDEVWGAIRSQSAERLMAAVQAGMAENYGELVSLYLWAQPVLSLEELATEGRAHKPVGPRNQRPHPARPILPVRLEHSPVECCSQGLEGALPRARPGR